jgi:hypothetical protein
MHGISVLAGIAVLAIPAMGAEAAVTISNDTTTNMTCSGGVCAPTATDAVLNTSDLESLLASGTATVTTTGSGVQADNIVIADGVTWTSANVLNLDAYQSITVNSPVSVDGTGGLSLTTNDGGVNGALTFGKKGQVDFANLSSALAINGASYVLVGDIHTLASDIGANPSGNFALAADYDASNDGTYSTPPVGTTFSGNFEGLGHIITSLSIDDANDEYVGLFARLDGGRIFNIGVTHVSVIAGNSSNYADCAVGALLGYDNGTVGGSYSSGAVSGVTATIGGLIGTMDSAGRADHSYSSASVTASGNAVIAGGLAGSNFGTIKDSYASGSISSSSKSAVLGGLVGGNEEIVETSFALGNIEAVSAGDCGGLAGTNYPGSTVRDSYATGIPTCTSANAGGFASDNSGAILESYSTGRAAGTHDAGFVVEETNGSLMQRDYWDTTTSGTNRGVYQGASTGLRGLTTPQLETRLPKGFSPDIWAENPKINGGFPYLIANPPPK